MEERESSAGVVTAQDSTMATNAAHRPIRFRGKVAAWFYLVALGCNVLPLMSLLPFADPEKQGAEIAAIVILILIVACDALIIPMVVRNYVEFDTNDNLVVAFGVSTTRIPLKKISEVYKTGNVLASTAASLDRIFIKAHWDETMIAVKDEEAFFTELQKRCPEANITKNVK